MKSTENRSLTGIVKITKKSADRPFVGHLKICFQTEWANTRSSYTPAKISWCTVLWGKHHTFFQIECTGSYFFYILAYLVQAHLYVKRCERFKQPWNNPTLFVIWIVSRVIFRPLFPGSPRDSRIATITI